MQEDRIINRVALSSLISFDLEKLHEPGERITIDIKDQLYEGIILKEKSFREFIKETDWSTYQNKFVAITCSADAIVPTWAFMLLAGAVQPFASKVFFGSTEEMESALFKEKLDSLNWDEYQNAKVVIKGCSKVNVPVSAYVEVIKHLKPVASSIMYGEPCSTVPLFKRPR